MISIIFVLNTLLILGSTCFKTKSIDKYKVFLEMKSLQFIQNDEVFEFSDVIILAQCALNIE